jgi:hypothetical protein
MNNVYILLLAPRLAGEARATSIPVVCKERQQSRCPPSARAKMQTLFIDRS